MIRKGRSNFHSQANSGKMMGSLMSMLTRCLSISSRPTTVLIVKNIKNAARISDTDETVPDDSVIFVKLGA